jgi:hypothetical protein
MFEGQSTMLSLINNFVRNVEANRRISNLVHINTTRFCFILRGNNSLPFNFNILWLSLEAKLHYENDFELCPLNLESATSKANVTIYAIAT